MSATLKAIGLVVHSGNIRAIVAADVIRVWARDHAITCTDIDVWSTDDEGTRADAAHEAARAGAPGLIVTVGGDGTFLRGVRVAATIGAMVLGVDVGRVGFLTETEVADLDGALESVLAGKFTVDERLMLTMCASRPLAIPTDVEALIRRGRGPTLPSPGPRPRRSPHPRTRQPPDPRNGVPLDILALNDIVFEKLARDRQASVAVYVDGKYFTAYSADAVIVSTPTGSTAYSFSASGPILYPRMDALVFTPVAPHMSFNRSLVLGPDQRIAIKVLARSGQVAVSVDGALRGVLDPSDWISVSASASRARLTRLRDVDFLGRLRERFGLADARAAIADGATPELDLI